MKTDRLNKTKYVTFRQCPKKAWYTEFNKIEDAASTSSKSGTLIGELARKLFDNVLLLNSDSKTPSSPGTYAEAPLRYNNLYCACDIFVIRDDNKVDIYEVKSVSSESDDPYKNKGNESSDHPDAEDEIDSGSLSSNKPKLENKFLYDLSFQYYLAIKNNFDVNSINLVTINKNLVYKGESYDSKDFLKKFFLVTDYTDEAKNEQESVENNIKSYFELDSGSEPNCIFSSYCKANNGCVYLERCKEYKGLPLTNSVYDLYSCQSTSKYIENGLRCFKDLYTNEIWEKLSEFNKRMINFSLLNIEYPYINKTDLTKFLKKIKFPIYFFDFETVSSPLPLYINSRPYQQVPFQYSLHVMNTKDETMDEIKTNNHHEYLGNGENDPREELIKQMITDLGNKGTIIAYNDDFERTRIKELIRDFPMYEKQLSKLDERFVDLQDVFAYSKVLFSGYKKKRKQDDDGNPIYEKEDHKILTSMVYLKSMYNSTSIKHVLPALYPDDKNFDYHNLNQVHNGGEASESYMKLKDLNDDEKKELRENMFKYCCLDTYAMVAIYFKLLDYLK